MAKRCTRCELLKSHEDFSATSAVCKPCVVDRNREYWRTPPGRMSQIFAVQTVSSRARNHPLPAYTRKVLYQWAVDRGLFALADRWRESGYEKDLTPSVDRLDATQPYTLDNIRLVTWVQNNDKAYEDRKSCTHVTKQCRKVEQLSIEGEHIAYFDSIAAAARATGAIRTNINSMCAGKPALKSVGGFIWRYVP